MAAVRSGAARSGSDERGQVVSSVVAMAAVVAVVVGLLVLFGTGGTDGKSAASPSTPPPLVPSPSPVLASSSAPTTPPSTTAIPTPKPTTASSPTRETAPTTRPTTQPTTRPTATGPRPSVEIYNNTTQRGLADRVASRATQAGWKVAGIDNWRGKVAGSTVYYPPGMRDHATALAADLGIGRVKVALDNMKTDRLTVILTSDYAG